MISHARFFSGAWRSAGHTNDDLINQLKRKSPINPNYNDRDFNILAK